MKLFLFITFLILLTPSIAKAVTVATTPVPSPTVSQSQKNETFNEQVNSLKERLASKVAELNLVEKRGIVGTVKDVSNTILTLEDLNSTIRLVDVDELTKFSSNDAKEQVGISDIKKGQFIGVLGTYNKNSKRVLARFIKIRDLPLYTSGKITDIDRQNFNITIIDPDKMTKIIDIETTTSMYTYGKDNVVTKFGFSKITTDMKMIALGVPHKTEKNRLTGEMVLFLPSETP